jgi:hypothetical protein
LAAEAEAWVRSGRRQWPFSFVNICEVLGFDVEAMRAHLLARPRNAAQRWHGGGHTIRSGRALGIVTSRRKEQLTHDAS